MTYSIHVNLTQIQHIYHINQQHNVCQIMVQRQHTNSVPLHLGYGVGLSSLQLKCSIGTIELMGCERP